MTHLQAGDSATLQQYVHWAGRLHHSSGLGKTGGSIVSCCLCAAIHLVRSQVRPPGQSGEVPDNMHKHFLLMADARGRLLPLGLWWLYVTTFWKKWNQHCKVELTSIFVKVVRQFPSPLFLVQIRTVLPKSVALWRCKDGQSRRAAQW